MSGCSDCCCTQGCILTSTCNSALGLVMCSASVVLEATNIIRPLPLLSVLHTDAVEFLPLASNITLQASVWENVATAEMLQMISAFQTSRYVSPACHIVPMPPVELCLRLRCLTYVTSSSTCIAGPSLVVPICLVTPI